MSDEQSRGSIMDSELALDADLKFLGLRVNWVNPIGAYYSTDRPTIPITVGLSCLVNTYTFPALYVEVTADLTNTMTVAPYRGGGRPEPIYVTESIIEKAARQVGVDPGELRRRNTIPASAMPYPTPMQQVYDSGDFVKNLDDCLALGDHPGHASRVAAAKAHGKLFGIGVATATAATGGRDYEHAETRRGSCC
jgi:carbon-monoxide dehydrogenase large subunit